jgi:hypothetical protein
MSALFADQHVGRFDHHRDRVPFGQRQIGDGFIGDARRDDIAAAEYRRSRFR